MRPWELERVVEDDADAALWVDRLVATWLADHAATVAAHADATHAAEVAGLQRQGYEVVAASDGAAQADLQAVVAIDWTKVRQRPPG